MTGFEISSNLFWTISIGIVVVCVFALVINIVVNKDRNASQKVSADKGGSASTAQNTGDGNTTTATSISVLGNGNQITFPREEPSVGQHKKEDQDYMSAHILFIDDDPEYKIDKILQKMGFRHVEKISDVTSVELTEIKQAEILFIDYNNVGKEVFGEKEGLGAALAIKKHYPSKKIVVYSGFPHMYDNDLKQLDGLISKNSAPEQIRATIEDLYKS